MNRANRPAEPRAAFVHPLQLIERPDPPRVAPGDDGQAGITAGTCCLQVLLIGAFIAWMPLCIQDMLKDIPESAL